MPTSQPLHEAAAAVCPGCGKGGEGHEVTLGQDLLVQIQPTWISTLLLLRRPLLLHEALLSPGARGH